MLKYLIIILTLSMCTLAAQSTEEIKRKIKASGLSDSQLRQMAKQRGYTDKQIEAKVQEIKEKSAQESSLQNNINQKQIISFDSDDKNEEVIESSEEDGELQKIKVKGKYYENPNSYNDGGTGRNRTVSRLCC